MIIKSKYLYTFVSTGDKTAMYTLRVMSDDLVQLGPDQTIIRNAHFIQNLSNDKDKASEKGRLISQELGVPFKDNADFDLKEIKRQRDEFSQEKREAYERSLQEKIKFEREAVEQQIRENIILIGKYKGETPEHINDIDQAYLFWLAGNKDANGILGISAKIADNYINLNNIASPDYFGNENESIQCKVKIKGIYRIEGIYGIQFLFKTAEIETGSLINFYTTSKKFLDKEPEDVIEISGMVKSHQEDRNGLKNTIISKPKYVLTAEEQAIKKVKPKKLKM